MFVETGLAGLVAYVGLLVAVAVLLRRALRHPRVTGLARGLVVAAAASTAAFVVNSIGGNLISQLAILLYFFTLLGLASAVLEEAREAEETQPVGGPGVPEPVRRPELSR